MVYFASVLSIRLALVAAVSVTDVALRRGDHQVMLRAHVAEFVPTRLFQIIRKRPNRLLLCSCYLAELLFVQAEVAVDVSSYHWCCADSQFAHLQRQPFR